VALDPPVCELKGKITVQGLCEPDDISLRLAIFECSIQIISVFDDSHIVTVLLYWQPVVD
jgi:hypothetical protein